MVYPVVVSRRQDVYDPVADISTWFSQIQSALGAGFVAGAKGIGAGVATAGEVVGQTLLPVGLIAGAGLIYYFAPRKAKLFAAIPALFAGLSLFNIGRGLVGGYPVASEVEG